MPEQTLTLLVRSLVLGFAIAAPVGPIGLLCIRRTLAGGRLSGLATGLGAASADAVYGAVAGFGLTLAAGVLIEQRYWLQPLGGLFIAWLGWRTFSSKPVRDELSEAANKKLIGAYFSAFFLTISNPLTILSFTAIFSGFGIGLAGGDLGQAASLVAGVFIGSALWWFLLTAIVTWARLRVKPQVIAMINQGAGILLFILGTGIVLQAVRTGIRPS